jgi:N,N'-diacetyllegionaminate synthase
MNLGSREFDFIQTDHTIIIAEIGVNHNGDPALAEKLVDAAVQAGADAVKFQAFCAAKEISKYAAKAAYQQATTFGGTQLEMCQAFELDAAVLKGLKNYCASVKIGFLCSVFDFDTLDMLVDEVQVETIKIPSGEITNLPMLKYIGGKNMAAFLSTGASTLAEVELAVAALLQSGCPDLVLFHCVSSYPAPYECVNLRAMRTLREKFGLQVGFSDHTLGIQTAIAAAALGAVAIEKHLTLDRTMAGPDHQASIEPQELAELVKGVKIANLVLGSPLKQPVACEAANLPLIRKSLVAGVDLPRGSKLSRELVAIKRPSGGIEPEDLERVIGRTVKRDIAADTLLQWEDLD